MALLLLLLLVGPSDAGVLRPRLRPQRAPRRQQQQVPPTHNASSVALDAFRRDFIFYERLAALILRTAGRAAVSFRRLVCRALNFPPRVMVVSLKGIIAAEDEVRVALEAAQLPELVETSAAPELSIGAAGARGHGAGDLINLQRCEKLLERAFRAPGVRAVCLLINSPGGSPAQVGLAVTYRHLPLPTVTVCLLINSPGGSPAQVTVGNGR